MSSAVPGHMRCILECLASSWYISRYNMCVCRRLLGSMNSQHANQVDKVWYRRRLPMVLGRRVAVRVLGGRIFGLQQQQSRCVNAAGNYFADETAARCVWMSACSCKFRIIFCAFLLRTFEQVCGRACEQEACRCGEVARISR